LLGRYAYCSTCGTRNDPVDFEEETIAAEDCGRDAVSAFDWFIAQVVKELTNLMPLSKCRKRETLERSFQNLGDVLTIFSEWFDIDPCAGIKQDELERVVRMFFRHHVYEHNGGGSTRSTSISAEIKQYALKQHIHETREGAHDLLGSLVKMARNVHRRFHELIPSLAKPIEDFSKRTS
jgi:hypothetical protein